MSTIHFDTLEATRRLREAGFAEPQAESVIRVLARAHEGLVSMECFSNRIDGLETRFDSIEKDLASRFDGLQKSMTIKLGSMIAVAVAVITALGKLL